MILLKEIEGIEGRGNTRVPSLAKGCACFSKVKNSEKGQIEKAQMVKMMLYHKFTI